MLLEMVACDMKQSSLSAEIGPAGHPIVRYLAVPTALVVIVWELWAVSSGDIERRCTKATRVEEAPLLQKQRQ